MGRFRNREAEGGTVTSLRGAEQVVLGDGGDFLILQILVCGNWLNAARG